MLLLLKERISGQIVTITGKLVNDQFYPVVGAWINDIDTTILTTEANGNFKANIPANSNSLIITGVGYESKLIHLANNCHHLEIILLNSGSYDYRSALKVDRRRKRHFDSLPELHRTAFSKGIFNVMIPCYIDKFLPFRERLNKKKRD